MAQGRPASSHRKASVIGRRKRRGPAAPGFSQRVLLVSSMPGLWEWPEITTFHPSASGSACKALRSWIMWIRRPPIVRLTVSGRASAQGPRSMLPRIAASGNHVEELHRERLGGLSLPDGIAPDQWKLLSEEEIGLIFD